MIGAGCARALRHGLAAIVLALLPVAATGGEVVRYFFTSETLNRYYPYTIYLPEGYGEGDLAYPVVYMLHGSFGDEYSWVTRGRLRSTVDRLIRLGEIPPAIVVMPGSRSWWVDGHNEKARTAFFRDLVPHIEATWRVMPGREYRAVGGLSAGGYGTINFMLERPDMFSAAAAMSPAVYSPYPPATSSSTRHPAFRAPSGQFDRTLWESLNYTRHLGAYLEQSHIVPLYLSAGDRDPFDIAHHASILHEQLEAHQSGHVDFEVLPGGHRWRLWRRNLPEALRFIFRYTNGPIECPGCMRDSRCYATSSAAARSCPPAS